uniref:Uncharacterized protein n=1 Tax=Anguilla anguilla TaxID=7936 RepID=A0A0E9QXH1_ANGAN
MRVTTSFSVSVYLCLCLWNTRTSVGKLFLLFSSISLSHFPKFSQVRSDISVLRLFLFLSVPVYFLKCFLKSVFVFF